MFGYDLKSLGGETMSYFLVSFPYSNKRLEKVEAEKYLLNEWMNEYKVGRYCNYYERNNSKKKSVFWTWCFQVFLNTIFLQDL